MNDPVVPEGPPTIRTDDELIMQLARIDDNEVVRNLATDLYKSTKATLDQYHEQTIAHIDDVRDSLLAPVREYFLANERRLKQKRYKNKFTLGGTVFTVQILKRALVTTKEQDKELINQFQNRRGLKKNVRYVPELDRERISSGTRLTRSIVALVGGYIGHRQKTTIKTPSMRTPLLMQERHYPKDTD